MIKALPEILVGTFIVFITTFLASYFNMTPSNMIASAAFELVFFRLVYIGTRFLFSLKKRRYQS
ncbi:hypothetical protein G6R29_00935 [Fructobacillus sp. M2-14]|uniref:Uncharacterized protein n=1 Tax=Fructobacillus broussonetiae TaxID=2713173 RepID=A0ABS5QYD5_9LACO|nr:hypothetical protein [Fructobacillus broussonetiae]MBS9338198.1 hypothetical protein [Fructobacillus broussonetiae]